MSDSLWPYVLLPARLLSPWGFSRQEYWSGLACPSPRDLPDPGIKPTSFALLADSLRTEPPGRPKYICIYFKIEKKTTQTKKQPPCHPAPVQSSSWHFEKTQCVQTMAFCSACICYRSPSRSVQFQSDSMVQNKVMNLCDPTVSLSSSCLTWPAQPVPTSHPQYK